jgi:plasmid stabilization system protein ParE
LIALSPEADKHLARLTEHYEALDRLEAAENLLQAVEGAKRRIAAATATAGLLAPRPYPDLKRLGFRWIIERHYWFSYTQTTPPVITAIFHETANIPGWF